MQSNFPFYLFSHWSIKGHFRGSDWWRNIPRVFSELHSHNQLLLQHFQQIKMLNHKTKRFPASSADCNLDMLPR